MPDHSEIDKIADRLRSSTKKLHELVPLLGMAKQVKEFSSDQRKQALAVEMVKSLKAGEGAAASDAIARASDAYAAKMTQLGKDYAEAERVIAEWKATQASFEAARSLLSMQRENLRQLS